MALRYAHLSKPDISRKFTRASQLDNLRAEEAILRLLIDKTPNWVSGLTLRSHMPQFGPVSWWTIFQDEQANQVVLENTVPAFQLNGRVRLSYSSLVFPRHPSSRLNAPLCAKYPHQGFPLPHAKLVMAGFGTAGLLGAEQDYPSPPGEDKTPVSRRLPATRTLRVEVKAYRAPSLFTPENLLHEARRQKGLRFKAAPKICVLDPDGDIVRHLVASGRARPEPVWPCYHTELHVFRHKRQRLGIVGCAVGAPFAVLVAEELFASGCELLISVTSAGEIVGTRKPPYFVLIDRALRDEGTSYHYKTPAAFSRADPLLLRRVHDGLRRQELAVIRGATWTTDAPFRETRSAIRAARARGAIAVEMEAAALYAFARTRHRAVVCFAHVTNRMAQNEGDFEKGAAGGAHEALRLIDSTVHAWRSVRS
jgi:uridine phosphorylase